MSQQLSPVRTALLPKSIRSAALLSCASGALMLAGCAAPASTPVADPGATEVADSGEIAPAPVDEDASATATSAGGPAGATAAPGAPAFDWFRVTPESVNCSAPDETVPILIEWMSSEASEAWLGIDTEDARAEPFTSVAPVGTYLRDFYCDRDEMTFTVSIANADGTTHASAVVVREDS